MKNRLSNQLGCAEKEKILPEDMGYAWSPMMKAHTITHSLPPILFSEGAASSRCALRNILVLEAQRA